MERPKKLDTNNLFVMVDTLKGPVVKIGRELFRTEIKRDLPEGKPKFEVYHILETPQGELLTISHRAVLTPHSTTRLAEPQESVGPWSIPRYQAKN